MSFASVTYTFVNTTTADAGQVNTNFQDLIDATSDGTIDFNIAALTVAGTGTFNGNNIFGNASSDTLTVNASLASSIPILTTNSYDLGSATKGMAGIYFSTGGSTTVRLIGSTAGTPASYSFSLPSEAGFAGDLLRQTGSSTWASVPSGITLDLSGGASGVTLTNSTTDFKSFAPTAGITVKLDNSFKAGRKLYIYNAGTGNDDIITITANDDSVIRRVYPLTTAEIMCNTTTPTTNTSWTGLNLVASDRIDVSSLISFDGLGTIADADVYMVRTGGMVEFHGWVEAGTVAATTLAMSLPSGVVIDTYESAHLTFGLWASHRASSWLAAGDGGAVTYLTGSGTGKIAFVRDGNADSWSAMNANAVLANSGTFSFFCKFKVSGWSAFSG